MTRFTVRAFTDLGLRRKRNEDALLVAGWLCQTHDGSVVTMEFQPAPPFVCAVADGMGGHAGGNLASRTALNVLAETSPGWESAEDVAEALHVVNEQVRLVGVETAMEGLGTTVAGLCAVADSLIVFNVGDSRLYKRTAGALQQISVDDSVFDSEGRPTNVITQSLGQPVSVRPHVTEYPLAPGTYLMCSDGVSGLMSTEELSDAMLLDDLDETAAEIIATTRANGAHDNFSFLIVEIHIDDYDGTDDVPLASAADTAPNIATAIRTEAVAEEAP